MGVMAERTSASIERDLRKALAGRRLAGELRLTEEELEEIEHHIEELARSGMSANALARHAPALLVTYLSAVGVHRYTGGAFWPFVPVAERLRSNAMGAAFKNAVRALGLTSFDDLVSGEGAAEYVARILAHGGIPRYCLADYFGALHAGLRQVGSAEDLLSLWRTRPERLAHLDKPIGRFLRYGGDEARDLVVRSTELVDETLSRGRVPAAEDVGLPEHFVEEYAGWRRRGAAVHPASRRVSIARPRVEIDPWATTGPHLLLPTFGERDAWWKVVGEAGAPRSFRASDMREHLVPLEPARSWDVTLESDGVDQRLFTFEAFGELPALLFDPATTSLVRDPLNLRLDRVICLYPEDAALEAIGSDGSALGFPHEIETYPTPTGEWRGFQLALFDLGGVSRLRFTHAGVERVVRIAAPESRLRLMEVPVFGVSTTDGQPVYSGAVRALVPEDLRKFDWTIRTRRGNGVVEQSTARADSEGVIQILSGDDLGEYDVHVTGVLGFDLQQRVAIVPGLEIRRPESLLLPQDVDVQMFVGVRPGLMVDGHSPSAYVGVPNDMDVATVVVGDDTGRNVELRVQVPRLVWGVVGETGSGAGLSNDVLRLDADDVERGRTRALILRAGNPGLRLTLRLRSRSDVLQEPQAGETRDEGRWAFDLRPFQDAVRQSSEPVLRFELGIGARHVHVADVVVRYSATSIRATSRVADDFTEVALTFDESGAVRGRVARLWSLDRPWEDAIEERIPDGQAGLAVMSGYGRIPPGSYLAEIAVDDGWTRRARPLLGAPSTARIVVGDQHALRSRTEALDPSDALDALELAVTDGHVSEEMLDAIDFGQVAEQALASFVWMLANAPYGERLPRATNAVRKALLDSFEGLLRAVVGASEHGVPDETLRRVELLTLPAFDKYPERVAAVWSRLDDDELRAVWRVAPALAATVDLEARPNDPAADARLLQLLGSADDDLPALSGFRIDPRLLDRPGEQLRALAELLEIFPGPLLERRTLEAACFEVLLAESEFDKERHFMRPSEWFDRHTPFVRPLLRIPGYRDALAPRLAHRGDVPWAGLPAKTLAAAIHVRRRTSGWIHALRALDEALPFAPSLIRHDLIAAGLLIHRLRAGGRPC